MSEYVEGLHAPFRRSKAPVIKSLVRAFQAGANMFRLRDVSEAGYLETASGRWLDEWASLYAYVRKDGEDDRSLRTRMKALTVLKRMNTTNPAIIASILQATGLRVRIGYSQPRVNRFDELAGMAAGDHSLDYGVINHLGQEVFDNVPETTQGYSGRGPWRPAWGPGGMIITVPAAYEEGAERFILNAIRDNLPSLTGFDLAWILDLDVTVSEALTMAPESGMFCWEGWGDDGWGNVPYGSDCVDFKDGGWSVSAWGDSMYGSPRRTA